MTEKVLIFGSGWLGNKFKKFLPQSRLSKIDIANPKEVCEILDCIRPDIVINAAGKTGGKPNDPPENIDWCEVHKEETRRSNVLGPIVLADACVERGVYLVHLSSGCIFDGESPIPGGWKESDFPNPVSYYSQTKVEAEYRLLNLDAQILIVRLRMPVDSQPSPRNLITKLARYPKVIDVVNSVTVVDDFLEATVRLGYCGQTGIFNVTNPAPVRHREIMEWYRELVNPDHCCKMITVEQMYDKNLATARRSNCILNTDKLSGVGITLPDSEIRIRECLREYKNYLKPS